MTFRQELLAVPAVDHFLKEIVTTSVYVVPNRRKHESGWMCMDLIAILSKGRRVRFGGVCDDLAFVGTHFRMDCDYPSGIIHIWNRNDFKVCGGLSSITFVEEGYDY